MHRITCSFIAFLMPLYDYDVLVCLLPSATIHRNKYFRSFQCISYFVSYETLLSAVVVNFKLTWTSGNKHECVQNFKFFSALLLSSKLVLSIPSHREVEYFHVVQLIVIALDLNFLHLNRHSQHVVFVVNTYHHHHRTESRILNITVT